MSINIYRMKEDSWKYYIGYVMFLGILDLLCKMAFETCNQRSAIPNTGYWVLRYSVLIWVLINTENNTQYRNVLQYPIPVNTQYPSIPINIQYRSIPNTQIPVNTQYPSIPNTENTDQYPIPRKTQYRKIPRKTRYCRSLTLYSLHSIN